MIFFQVIGDFPFVSKNLETKLGTINNKYPQNQVITITIIFVDEFFTNIFEKFIFFKGCIPKILLSPFFTTLSQMKLLFTENAGKNSR